MPIGGQKQEPKAMEHEVMIVTVVPCGRSAQKGAGSIDNCSQAVEVWKYAEPSDQVSVTGFGNEVVSERVERDQSPIAAHRRAFARVVALHPVRGHGYPADAAVLCRRG